MNESLIRWVVFNIILYGALRFFKGGLVATVGPLGLYSVSLASNSTKAVLLPAIQNIVFQNYINFKNIAAILV